VSRFISAVMAHFGGQVNSWTVDNEGLHKTFLRTMGGNDSLGKPPANRWEACCSSFLNVSHSCAFCG
jgi:hypothetical protein